MLKKKSHPTFLSHSDSHNIQDTTYKQAFVAQIRQLNKPTPLLYNHEPKKKKKKNNIIISNFYALHCHNPNKQKTFHDSNFNVCKAKAKANISSRTYSTQKKNFPYQKEKAKEKHQTYIYFQITFSTKILLCTHSKGELQINIDKISQKNPYIPHFHFLPSSYK